MTSGVRAHPGMRQREGIKGLFVTERRQWLIARARETGRIEVAEVASTLGVAVETIRRDLNELEDIGFVRRVHGGAIPVDRAGYESGLTDRASAQRAEKLRIATQLAKEVEGAEAVFLDEGSTCHAFATNWQPVSPVTVLTAALPNAAALASLPEVTVIMLGGRLKRSTAAAADDWAPRMLAEYVLDIAIVGANGVTTGNGLTVPDRATAAVKSAALASARRRILACDHSKFGVDSFIKFAPVTGLDLIITDKGVDDETASVYSQLGVCIERV